MRPHVHYVTVQQLHACFEHHNLTRFEAAKRRPDSCVLCASLPTTLSACIFVQLCKTEGVQASCVKYVRRGLAERTVTISTSTIVTLTQWQPSLV